MALPLSSQARGHGGLSVCEEAISHGGPDRSVVAARPRGPRSRCALRCCWKAGRPCAATRPQGAGALPAAARPRGTGAGTAARRGRVPGRRSADGRRTGPRRPPAGRSAGAADGPAWVLCELGRQLLNGWAPECRSTAIGHVRPGGKTRSRTPQTNTPHARHPLGTTTHHGGCSMHDPRLVPPPARSRREPPLSGGTSRRTVTGRRPQWPAASLLRSCRAPGVPASRAAAGRRSSGGMAGGA